MSPRSELLLLGLQVALAVCDGEDSPAARPPTSEMVAHPWVRALEDPDPAVRRRAAEGLGRLEGASRQVTDALLDAQHDDDPAVAAAALAALNRIHLEADVALRVYGTDCYEDVQEVALVRPEHVTWRKVPRESTMLGDGERQRACWLLASIPAIYETRVRSVLVSPHRGLRRDKEEIRAGDVPRVHGTASPPPWTKTVPLEGEPAGAHVGEVWCRVGAATGASWRRMPACEVPAHRR